MYYNCTTFLVAMRKYLAEKKEDKVYFDTVKGSNPSWPGRPGDRNIRSQCPESESRKR